MWLRYNFSKEKSLSHRFTVTSLPVHQSTVISHQSTVISHLSQLISALGLVEFPIQWFWSIATNPSLELTETTHHSLLNHYTTTPLTIPVTSSLPAFLGRQVIFDKKLYREVLLSHEIGRFLCNIYAFITFYHRRKK